MQQQADAPTTTAAELVNRKLELRVWGRGGEAITAVIWPTALTSNRVSAVVEWHGTEVLSSIVSSEGDASTLGLQHLLLIWTAAGAQSVRAVPTLGADRWCLARLTLPDIRGQSEGKLRVTLNRRKWTGTLTAATQPGLCVELPIPAELRHREIGSLMAEMTSRLAFGQPWETTMSGRK